MRVDKEADALSFRLDESRIVEAEEIRTGVIVDYESWTTTRMMKSSGWSSWISQSAHPQRSSPQSNSAHHNHPERARAARLSNRGSTA